MSRFLRHSGAGFSLIEVMVATAIFAIGLGGIALMLLTSIRGTIEARNQSTAALLASNLAETILMNPGYLGHYLNPVEAALSCPPGIECTGPDWAADSLENWQRELDAGLGEADGTVCRDRSPADGQVGAPECDGAGMAVVKVFWREPHRTDDAAAGYRRVVLPVLD